MIQINTKSILIFCSNSSRLVFGIDKYGSKIHAFNYQAETSTITNLVNDLETIMELINAIALLVINDVVSELKASNS